MGTNIRVAKGIHREPNSKDQVQQIRQEAMGENKALVTTRTGLGNKEATIQTLQKDINTDTDIRDALRSWTAQAITPEYAHNVETMPHKKPLKSSLPSITDQHCSFPTFPP